MRLGPGAVRSHTLTTDNAIACKCPVDKPKVVWGCLVQQGGLLACRVELDGLLATHCPIGGVTYFPISLHEEVNRKILQYDGNMNSKNIVGAI